MEQLRDVQSYLLDRLGQFQYKAERLKFKIDPRAAEAQSTFNALGQPLSVYLNNDGIEHTPPKMLQVRGSDGSEYISIRRFEGRELENFEAVRVADGPPLDSSAFYYLLPKRFELQREQIAVAIAPRSLTTGIENQVRIWRELEKRDIRPWGRLVDSDVLSTLDDKQKRAILFQQGTTVFALVSRFAPELFNPNDWTPAYGSLNLTGRFYHPFLGDGFYGANVYARIVSGERQTVVYADLAKKFNSNLAVYRSSDLYTDSEEQIDQETFIKYGKVYILQKGTAEGKSFGIGVTKPQASGI